MNTKCSLCFALLTPVLFCSACSESVEFQKSIKSDVADLRSIQAEHTAAISELRAELRRMSGKVEEVQHTTQGKATELEQTLRQVSSRVPPPSGVPEDLLNRDEEQIARNSGSDADQYRKALQQLRQGDFDGARDTLNAFIQTNPQTSFTDNAYFWLGICSEKQGRFDEAIVSFSEVFQKFPAEDMVPAALFRIGSDFEKLGSKNDAILTFQKLVEDHPRSSFAEQARSRLSELQPGKAAILPKRKK